jgi:hypothetical protein
MKRTLFFLLVTLTGCVTNKYALLREVGPELLIVPTHDTRRGTNLFLIIKNVEHGTVKAVVLNGIKMGKLAAGDAIEGRFTDLIYEISEKLYQAERDPLNWSDQTLVTYYKIRIQVDLIEGKSNRPHFTREVWISRSPGRGTAMFEI